MAKTPEKWLKAKRKYNDRPEMRERNKLQKRAWRAMVKAGKIRPGDGKAVDHIRALDSGGGNGESNLRVVPAAKNKGWRKGTSTYSPAKGKFNK
jgi:hypothetical protein